MAAVVSEQQGEAGTTQEAPTAPEETGEEPRERPTCDVCQAAVHKYKCPGCGMRTCCLACTKQHKADTGCSGQRNKLEFVPLQEFGDRELLSDYAWLEEVKRADDNARRLRPPGAKRELPPHLATLVQQARQRGVRLMIMAPGMQRRKQNSSRYNFHTRTMEWHVEWAFPSATDAPRTVNPRVEETKALAPLLSGHLTYAPGVAAKHFALRAYADAGVEHLKVFMRKEGCPANAQRYYSIDMHQSLRSQLAGKSLLEHPTFIVALPGEEGNYPAPTAEEEAQEQQRQQQQQQQQRQVQLPRPPPPPQRSQDAAQHQQQQGQQQQKAGDGPAHAGEPPPKRARTEAPVAGASGTCSRDGPDHQQQEQQQQQQQLQHSFPPPPATPSSSQQQPARPPSSQRSRQQTPQQPPKPAQQGAQQLSSAPAASGQAPGDAGDDADLLAGLED